MKRIFAHRLGGVLVGASAIGAVVVVACSSSPGTGTSHPDGGTGGMADGGSGEGGSSDAGDGGVPNGTPGTFNVFNQQPQFGIYTSSNPADYTPPAGVLMWSYGTVFVTQLTAAQQAQIGSDLAAKITYIAQCDNYDRIGGLFFIVEPKGQMPEPTDPRTEIVRWITPFSDYTEGKYATLVYPDASLAPFAQALADTSHDVWIGIAGGSNPYGGDPCTVLDAGADFSQVGFKYSVDFASTQPLYLAPSTVLTGLYNLSVTTVPITATLTNPTSGPLTGSLTVIISGHGSSAGGDEYDYSKDTLDVNSTQAGYFTTEMDCAPYAQYSPDGNPGIFQDNTTTNFRNWCPGALVPAHTYPVTLNPGSNMVNLAIFPAYVPSGSYFATSITFTSP